MEEQKLSERLRTLLARELGRAACVQGLHRTSVSAGAATWAFDAVLGERRVPLSLQRAEPAAARPSSAHALLQRLPQLSGTEEAALVRTADRHGLPVPQPRWVAQAADGLGGCIYDRAEGETRGHRVVRDPEFNLARRAFAQQCGELLATLHRIDPDLAPFLAPHGAASAVDLWRSIYEALGQPQPILDLGFRWARAHLPTPSRLAIVHGDFRLGNFAVGARGIRAVLAWTGAHLGDPMEDLGWLCLNRWRYGARAPVAGVGQRETLFESYRRAGGEQVDAQAVRFWEAFGNLKWSVVCMLAGQPRDGWLTLAGAALGRRAEEPLLDFLDLVFARREGAADAQ